MPFPDVSGYAPQQLLNGGFSTGGYQIPAAALPYLSAEQIQMLGGSNQQNPVDAFIQSLPPEVQSNPTAILQAASSDPSLAQAVAERFGLDAGSMTFENPYRHPLSEALMQGAKDVLIPWGAATGAIALSGAGGGGAAAIPGSGSATVTGAPIVSPGVASGSSLGGLPGAFPLGSAGSSLGAGVLGPGVTGAAGSAFPLGAAGGSLGAGVLSGGGAAAASQIPKWLDYAIPGVNALLGYKTADKAADIESQAYDRAISEGARQYDTTRQDLMPWLTEGGNALKRLADPTTNFQASPDYNFVRGEQLRGLENSFASRGMGQSGNALRALQERSADVANSYFGDWWNRQAGLAGVGQTTATTLGDFGANNAARTGNYLANQGASRSSGVLGKYSSVVGGLGDVYDNYLYRRRGR
jgi:hypothetical protein